MNPGSMVRKLDTAFIIIVITKALARLLLNLGSNTITSESQFRLRGATLRVQFPTLYTLRVSLKASVPKVYGAATGLAGRAPTIPKVQEEELDAETY